MAYLIHGVASKGMLFLRSSEAAYLSCLTKRSIKEIKDRFHIVSHYTTYTPAPSLNPHVDIYMSPNSSVLWAKRPNSAINMSSRDFLLDYNSKPPQEPDSRYYDFAFISTLSPNKRVLEWLRLILSLRNNSGIKTITILPFQQNSYFYYLRVKRLLSLMSRVLLSSDHSVILLKTHPLNPLYPLPSQQIKYILQGTKVFVHLSDYEGECRIIKEALTSGCFIFANKDMKGAALDECDPTNSYKISLVDLGAHHLLSCLNRANTYQGSSAQISSCTYDTKNNVQKFIRELNSRSIYIDEHVQARLYTENLAYLLPGHYPSIPSDCRGSWYQGTLQSFSAFKSYLKLTASLDIYPINPLSIVLKESISSAEALYVKTRAELVNAIRLVYEAISPC